MKKISTFAIVTASLIATPPAFAATGKERVTATGYGKTVTAACAQAKAVVERHGPASPRYYTFEACGAAQCTQSYVNYKCQRNYTIDWDGWNGRNRGRPSSEGGSVPR